MLVYLIFPESHMPIGKLYHILHGAASASNTRNNPVAFICGLSVIKWAFRKLHFLWVFNTFPLQAPARGASHTYLLKSSVRVELMAWSTLLMASRSDVATNVSPLRPTSVASPSTKKQQNTLNLLWYYLALPAQGCTSTSPGVTSLQNELRFHLQYQHHEFVFKTGMLKNANCLKKKVAFSGDVCGHIFRVFSCTALQKKKKKKSVLVSGKTAKRKCKNQWLNPK